MILTGKYVRLRPLMLNDAEITWAWRMSERAMLLHTGAGTVEEQWEWIANRPPNEYNWIIELLDGTPVGMYALTDIDPPTATAARFIIGERTNANGGWVAAEATRLLYWLAFDSMGLSRLNGTVNKANVGMIHWNSYIGWERDNEETDEIVIHITAETYRRVTRRKLDLLLGD
jgi:RimJ/RimL family protein N-acetyltransferase